MPRLLPNTNRLAAPAVAIAIVGLLAAACGGGATPTTGPGGGGPTAAPATQSGGGGGDDLEGEQGLCGRFSSQLATAALGEAVDDGTPNRGTIGGLTYFCRYTSVSGNVLDIEYSPGKTRATWDAEMTSAEMDDGTAVQGIGDAAWQTDSSGLGPGSRISAYANGGSIWVTVAKDGDQATMDAAVQQAAKALIAALAG